jgi:hypothetical protein
MTICLQSTVREVIRLADAARSSGASEDVDFSEYVPGLTPAARELRDYLKGLSDDEMAELTALAWLGREGMGDFSQLVKQASAYPDGAVEYLAEKAPFADYLRKDSTCLSPGR